MLSEGVLVAGKYRVIHKLGEGAMGSVWLVRNEATDREFALKVLLPQAAASPGSLARFLREAKVCGALRHPSILEIYDAGEAPELGGAPYLVMERLDGAALDTVLEQCGALPPRLAIDLVAQISRGLYLAHNKGIVHRDLKPANVYLHRPGTGALEPKVLDFGISKIITGPSDVALTHTAAILGSPLYMSPEQMAEGKGLDARSDVHALGVLLWECLTGQAPFRATSYNLLVVEIMQGPRPKLREVMPAASGELAQIVERSFAIDPAARFRSAADFADALEGELARLGGGVLAARSAAVSFLGWLGKDSKAPPAPTPDKSTTEPLEVDLLPRLSPLARSSAASTPASGPRSSATSFAQTEVAAVSGDAPRPAQGAVSTLGEARRAPERSRSPLLVPGLVLLAFALMGGAFAFLTRAPKTTEPLRADPTANASPAPPATSAAIEPAPPLAPPASVTAQASAAPPMASTRPASPATGPAPPARGAAPPATKKAPTRSSPPASAPTGRPKIDESGL